MIVRLAAPDIIVSYPFPPEPLCGVEAFKAFLRQFIAALPDVTVAVDDMIAEGDKVAVRWTFRGTHEGPLLGLPATGKQVQVSGLTFCRIIAGKVVEETGIGNTLGLMQQLGAAVVPPQT